MLPFRIIAIAASISLASCAAMKTPDSLESSQLQNNQAIIAGSYSHIIDREKFSYESLSFCKIGTDDCYHIDANDDFGFTAVTDYDAVGDNKESFIFVFPVPAGEYEFRYFYVREVNLSKRSQKGLSIPFTVVAGKTNYIGEILNDVREGKNFFGQTLASRPHWIFSDQFNRDIPRLQKKYPNISWQNSTKVIPSKVTPEDWSVVFELK